MGKYLKVDRDFIFSPQFGSTEKLILLALMDKKKCSYAQIAEKTHTSRRTVLRVIQDLEKKGVIVRKTSFREDGGSDMNEYEIVGLRGEANE